MVNMLQASRNHILFIELAGLLHDLGKLSKAFLHYRQTWQDDPQGYDKDPHEHFYLDEHEVEIFRNLIPPEFKTKISELDANGTNDKNLFLLKEPDFSIKKAIQDHHLKPENNALIMKMLKAADSIDSAGDRNNPLWSAEQKDQIFKSNVFGYEHEKICPESQEKARGEIYRSLCQNLPPYLSTFSCKGREDILLRIEQSFEQGLADTTRPQNDTTLWEHCYAVASIVKVLTVYNLFTENEKPQNEKHLILKFDDVKFGILGIGWDGIRFLSFGQKISDIVKRKTILDEIKKCLRHIIEYEYPIGNRIYADDNGIFFIVPMEFKDGKLGKIWSEIERKIYEKTAELSKGELQPHLTDIQQTNTLTSLVVAIKHMKKKTPYSFDNTAQGFDHYTKYLTNFTDGKTICPICRLRPVEDKDQTDNKKICLICKERRKGAKEKRDDNSFHKPKGSIFIDEIVDDNQRAALIVARFGLDKWLGGDMLRCLFVTEEMGIKREIDNLGKVKQFKEAEIDINNFLEDKKTTYGDYKLYNYQRIKADIDAFQTPGDEERAKHTAFLYHRRDNVYIDKIDLSKIRSDWEKIKESANEQMPELDDEKRSLILYNLLAAKTPTPSTILDVWATTEVFFQDMADNLVHSLLPEITRLRANLRSLNGENIKNWGRGTLEAVIEFSKKKIELIYGDNGIEVVGETYSIDSQKMWNDTKIRITDKENTLLQGNRYQIENCRGGDSFRRHRIITISPNLFMAIVPAERAIEITDLIYQNYKKQFGKVMGRLPFTVSATYSLGAKCLCLWFLMQGKE